MSVDVLMGGLKVTCPCDLCRRPVSQGGCSGGGTLLWIVPKGADRRKEGGKTIVACQPPNFSRQHFGSSAVNGNPICCQIGGRISTDKGGNKTLKISKREPLP